MKSDLMEHKFVSKLIVDIFNFYSNQKVDSPTYKYCKNVQHRLTKVKSTLETLQLIRLLIAEKHPSISTTNNEVIDRETILNYHVENYFTRLNSYKPDIICFIAAVHEWKIADESSVNASAQLLEMATRAGITGIADIIATIDKVLELATPAKSDITESTGMSAADISLIESVKEAENLIKHSLAANDNYEDDKNEYYTTSVASNLDEMTNIEATMYANFISVLDSFYETYAAKVPDTVE